MLQTLINKIEQLKQPIPNYDADLAEYTTYFENLTKKYPYKDYQKLINITYQETLVTYILLDNPTKTIAIKNLISKYPSVFANVKQSEILEMFLDYHNRPAFARLIDEYLTDKRFFSRVKKRINIISYMRFADISNKIAHLFKFLEQNPNAKDDFAILKGTNPKILNKTANLKGSLSGLKKGIKENKIDLENINNAISNTLRYDIEIAEIISSFFDEVSLCYMTNLKESKKETQKIIKYNKKLDSLIAKLQHKGEINDLDGIMTICPKTLKEEALDYIISHNSEYYHKLYETYESLKNNTPENLSLLFAKYNFNYYSLTSSNRKIIEEYTYESINQMLEFLAPFAPLDINEIVKINPAKIKLLEETIQNGISYLSLIKKPEIVYSNNNMLATILTNIKELNNHGLNIFNYQNSLEILTAENVIPNLNLLINTYGLLITKETTNINFLSSPNLSAKIDFLIESGNLELPSLDILNYSLEELIKMKILKDLNISNSNLDIDIAEFLIPTSNYKLPPDIANILKLAKPKNIPLPDFLTPYQTDVCTLLIGGIYISINRLLNNLSKFNSYTYEILYASIIYESHYTLEEITTLKEHLQNLNYNQKLVRKI